MTHQLSNATQMELPSAGFDGDKNADKRSWILVERHGMRITKELMNNENGSDVKIFWRIVTKLILRQELISSKYHSNKVYRDLLTNDADILFVQLSLWDCLKKTGQQLSSCINKNLSGKPRISGATYVNYNSKYELSRERWRNVQTRTAL